MTKSSVVYPTSPSNGSYAAWNRCASLWSAYDSFSSTAIIPGNATTILSYTVTTTSVSLGNADVYTSLEGVPIASGNFTPTKTQYIPLTLTGLDYTYTSITLDPSRLSATPTCSSLSPSACSLLYVSYIRSLGLPPNATVPQITPAPTNSPACLAGSYQPFSTCGDPYSGTDSCIIEGQNVQVFYFPSQGDPSSGITDLVVQSYAPGITFTSPSIYLSFDYLSAYVLGYGGQGCTSCGADGCYTASAEAVEHILQGTSLARALVSLPPEAASTFLLDYDMDRALNIARNSQLDPYMDYSNLVAHRLDVNALARPQLTDYYLNPSGVPHCDFSAALPACGTVFEGEYRAILSLPSQVSLLRGEWATCTPALGVTDPPIALTESSIIQGPTVPIPHHTGAHQTIVSLNTLTAQPVEVPTPTHPIATGNSIPNNTPLLQSGPQRESLNVNGNSPSDMSPSKTSDSQASPIFDAQIGPNSQPSNGENKPDSASVATTGDSRSMPTTSNPGAVENSSFRLLLETDVLSCFATLGIASILML